MKKICIDARMLHSAGIGTYLKEIISNLKSSPFKIFLIVTKDLLEKEKDFLNGFEIIILNSRIYSIKEQIFLPFKIPKCDIFFSPHFNIPIFKIKAEKRLVTIHDAFHLAFFSKLSFFEKIYAKFIINLAIKKSDKIITVSKFSKDEIIKYTNADPNKIFVIYNAVNTKIFSRTDDQERILEVINKYNLTNSYFLFVGNLKPHKNLMNLLKAFDVFIRDYPDIDLAIVGKNKNLINSFDVQKVLKNNKKLQSRIKLIDFAANEDLPVIYQQALALVFPSFYEGFGYPPLEAMAVNCPVIASNIASIKEICDDSVYYIDPYDYMSISGAMKKILNNKILKNDLIKKGSERIKLYTLKNFIKKHFELFESL
ncbi:MAG: glycosyltransferase family 1 protein [Parachlamydiales bacterium]|jgi:glycosyltransferase involved in cell wall biosynthesis